MISNLEFEVNTSEIWEFHFEEFLGRKIEEKTLKNLTDTLRLVIYNAYKNDSKNVYPFASKEMSDTKAINGDYYFRHVKDYLHYSKKSWRDQIINTPYFDTKDGFFDFHQNIIININHDKFDFFLIYKLNLFRDDMVQLTRFLDSLKEKKFDNKTDHFISYLDSILTQNEMLLFNSVFKRIRIYLNMLKSYKKLNDRKLYAEKNQDGDRILKLPVTKYRTFYLKALKKNKTLFEPSSQVYQENFKFYKKLLHNNIVDKELKFKDFLKIFEEPTIEDSQKIELDVSLVDLKEIIKIITNSEIIQDFENGNDKWKIGLLCFNLKKKKDKRFKQLKNYKQISDANGKNGNKVENFNQFFTQFENVVKEYSSE